MTFQPKAKMTNHLYRHSDDVGKVSHDGIIQRVRRFPIGALDLTAPNAKLSGSACYALPSKVAYSLDTCHDHAVIRGAENE
jgi:hypothetical protein